MTKKKIAVFGATGLAALLIGFALFAYYNFTHNFHIAISDQQASDIETALKGSLGEAIFSGQRAQVVADSTIEGKRGLDALLAPAPSDNKGQGLIEAYQKDPQKFKHYAQMLDTAMNAKQVLALMTYSKGAAAVPKREAGCLPVPSRKPAPCLYLAKVIAQKIDESVGAFDTSPQVLKELKKAGVHDSIILAMVRTS